MKTHYAPVFAKSLRDQWIPILGWGLGLGSLAYFTILLYPSMARNPQFEQLMQGLSPELRAFFGNVESFSTVDGYMTASLLVYLPLVLAIYAVVVAASLITGEIESGTMDFLLAHPLPRWRVVLDKYGALVASVVAIGLLLGSCMALGGLSIGSDVSLVKWMLAGLNVVPMTLFLASVAFGLACATRGRSIAIGAASTLALGGFILNSLAPLSETLRPYAKWTLYYWYTASRPLGSGIVAGHVAILLAGCLVCLGLGLAAFQRRDIIA